jgi:hypothetical protein
MDLIVQLAFITAFFLVLKAIEYRSVPNSLYRGCSIGAWIAFGVGVIVWLVT